MATHSIIVGDGDKVPLTLEQVRALEDEMRKKGKVSFPSKRDLTVFLSAMKKIPDERVSAR